MRIYKDMIRTERRSQIASAREREFVDEMKEMERREQKS